MADAPPVSRKRDVQRFALERRSVFSRSESWRLQRFQRRFDFDFDFVRNAAEFGALVAGQVCEGFEAEVVRRPDLRER